jgi:hypothetical protein
MHAQGGLPIPGIVHIEQPHWWALGRPQGLSPEAFGLQAARWLEDKIAEVGADRVAAFIGEPVQGAGGVIIPPESYWPEIQRICDRHGILLVSDEVICGFGRTGHWFGCERFGYRPDLMTFAKGITSGYIPLGGVMVGERVARVLIERGGEFNHGYTYSGHPVACAVALANLEVIEREGLVARVHDDTGPYLAAQFATLREQFPPAQVELVGIEIPRRWPHRHLPDTQRIAERVDDGLGDVFLDEKNVFQVAIEAVCPEPPVGAGINELGGNADPLALLAHRALQDVRDAQPCCHIGEIDAAPPVGE